MPKNLLLIRHAKSSWNNFNLADFERPLNKRGEKNAPEMAKRLISKNIIPQQLVSSPALRAISTAKLFASNLQINQSEIIQINEIYDANFESLLKIINNFDNSFGITALFGHNPSLSNLAKYLCTEANYDLATCGIILLRFPFDNWEMISHNTAELIFYDFPKNKSN